MISLIFHYSQFTSVRKLILYIARSGKFIIINSLFETFTLLDNYDENVPSQRANDGWLHMFWSHLHIHYESMTALNTVPLKNRLLQTSPVEQAGT